MLKKRLIKLYRFIRYNPNKRMYIHILFLSAYYRILIILFPAKVLQKLMGIRNEESSDDESPECYKKAAMISYVLHRICQHTPWQSKCLVRALTAQRMLKRLQITTTLYLGVGKDEERMIAHAWLRCGTFYVTGGTGDNYAVVAKFRTQI